MTGAVSVEDVGAVVRAVMTLPGCPAGRALTAFTDPALLARWWGGGELTTDLAAGGPYVVRFASLGRTMTGRIVSYLPPASLAFTWSWDHQEEPGRTVAVTTGGSETATLTIIHGAYGESAAERAARAEHRAGWEYFLPRLAATVALDKDSADD